MLLAGVNTYATKVQWRGALFETKKLIEQPSYEIPGCQFSLAALQRILSRGQCQDAAAKKPELLPVAFPE